MTEKDNPPERELDKSFNVAQGYLGVPGVGKSNRAARDVADLAKRHGAYILAIDSDEDIPEVIMPERRRLDIVRHSTEISLRSGYKSKPGAFHCLTLVPPETKKGEKAAEEEKVLDVALRVARDLVARGNRPVILYIDEIVDMDEASANYVHPTMRRLLSRRRHERIGVVWTTQTPANVHRIFYKVSTQVHVFRLTDEDDVQSVKRRLGMSKEEAAKIPSLPQFVSVEGKAPIAPPK